MWDPSVRVAKVVTGWRVSTSTVLPSTWCSTWPSVTYSTRGAAPVARSDTSSTPGAGWLPSGVGVVLWVVGAGAGAGEGSPPLRPARVATGTITATTAATP